MIELSRPFTLLAPAVGAGTCAATAALALDVRFPWLPVVAGVVSALFATVASNFWNQAFDVEIDRVNKPTRPVPSGRITADAARQLGWSAAALSIACALASTWVFLACVTVGLVATWIYSAPPLRTKRMPLGALFTIAVPRGLLVPVAGWSLVAPPTQPDPWWLGSIAFLFVLGAAATKDFADIKGDRAHGCETLPVLLGPKLAARWIAIWLVVPFVVYATLGFAAILPAPTAWVGLALAVVGSYWAWVLLRDAESLPARDGNHPVWFGMYLLMLGFYIATTVAYAIA